MPARVNLTHTIGDLRALFQASRPTDRPFVIATQGKEFTDDSMTVKDANLNMSTLWQRWVD